MTQVLEKTVENTEVKAEKKEGVVQFKKPYSFEGKEYKEIDLSGVEDLSGQDLDDAENMLLKVNKPSMLPEMSMTYLFFLAAKATGQPQEFFFQLPAKESLKVKRTVMGFLNAEE
jgi:Phage tail assembly chaperone proteins, E, or 41 or 14